MGMGTYACRANIISTDFVKEICPLEYQILIDILYAAGINLEDFFVAEYFDSDYGDIKEGFDEQLIDKAYSELKRVFNEKTGLFLNTVYHEAEDRGDELDGGSFAVEGVYVLSEAGKKFQEKISEVAWTIFG